MGGFKRNSNFMGMSLRSRSPPAAAVAGIRVRYRIPITKASTPATAAAGVAFTAAVC
jgi:hypothetical protein